MPEPELIDSIRVLYDQIDHRNLGDRALEIASDLVYAAPTLAVQMVEQATEGESDENDVAIARLALNAPRNATADADDDPAKEIRAKIRSPKLKEFIEAASLQIRDTSARQVFRKIDQLSSAEQKLFFLRQWTVQNRRREDAWEVVEAALNCATRATEYTPNARDMREIASPLPFVSDETRLRQLVGMFAANKGNFERHGPTVDYVRLLLLLARSEYRFDRCRGRSWFEEVYLHTADISDLAIRAECYARYLVALDIADGEKWLESTDKLHSLAEAELTKATQELLQVTAFHDTVFSGIVRALAVTRLDLAIQIALSLNTEPRRDASLVELIDARMATEHPQGGLANVRQVLNRIANPDERAEAIFKALDRTRRRRSIPVEWGTQVLQFLDPIKSIIDPEVRCRCLTRVYFIQATTDRDQHEKSIAAVMEQLVASLKAIDNGWEQVRAAFSAAAFLAPLSADHARALLQFADAAKHNALLQTENAAGAYIGTILLAFTAYAGLLRKGIADDQDVRRLEELVNRIPSNGERAGVWADLALRAYATNKPQLAQRIVNEHVRPLLQILRSENIEYASQIVARVFPALYCCFPVSARDDLRPLPEHLQDLAQFLTCRFIFRRHGEFDPFDTSPNAVFDVDYDRAMQVCELVEQMHRDDIAYFALRDLVYSLSHPRQRDRLSREQTATLVAKISEFVERKFPNLRYIKHEGYRICVRALVERLRRQPAAVWDNLGVDAQGLPNVSDKVFVLCEIASACQSRERQKGRDLLELAHQIAQTIPCVYDRVARTAMVAKEACEIDPGFGKRLLESGMKLALTSGSDELWPIQRDMLNFGVRPVNHILTDSLG
jgi:hypothetical protein